MKFLTFPITGIVTAPERNVKYYDYYIASVTSGEIAQAADWLKGNFNLSLLILR